MNKIIEIRIARESANDDTVILQEWHFRNGAPVKAGDVLVTLETSKAVLEVEAEADGFLEIIVRAGETAPIGTVIGRLQGQRMSSSAGKPFEPMEKPVGQHLESVRDVPSVRYSKLALAMMDHHSIPKEALPQSGLVRKEDVEAYLSRQAALGGNAESTPREESNSTSSPQESSISAEPLAPTSPSGGFFSDARKSAQERGHGIVWLALNYFFRNYLLGHVARLSPLGVNLLVHRLRGVKMGKGVYIDPSATIETAYPENVTIGDDVRITANAIIMTHIKAPHALRNAGIVPLVKLPVVLEDHCFIGVNAVIMPGVTIGRGSVVTSGSVVLTNVPPGVMVTGNPARIVKQLASPLPSADASNIEHRVSGKETQEFQKGRP